MKKNSPHIKALLRYISHTPELKALLYNLDLLPEQLQAKTKDWVRMILISEAWRHSKP